MIIFKGAWLPFFLYHTLVKMRILIIDKVHNDLPKILRGAGHECDIVLGEEYRQVAELVSDYQGIILRSSIRIDANFIDSGSKLKFIARVGAGMENIDIPYAESKGIECINSPEGNRTAVGEHAVGMILNLFNNMNRADSEVRQGVWHREANRGIELEGKTIGIIGYGNMGSAFAQRLKGFGVSILAFDKYKTAYSDNYVLESDMNTLFEQCDIISIHTPLTAETNQLICHEWLNKFHKNIFIINTARGPILKTSDLVTNLKNGKVLGACLDVLEYEDLGFENLNKQNLPEAFRYLASAKNVILSPHIAGWTHQSNYKLSKVIADKILALSNN